MIDYIIILENEELKEIQIQVKTIISNDSKFNEVLNYNLKNNIKMVRIYWNDRVCLKINYKFNFL